MTEGCIAIKRNGQVCGLAPVTGMNVCVFHSLPQGSEEQKEHFRKGGRYPHEWVTKVQGEGLDLEQITGLIFEVIENLRAQGQTVPAANGITQATRLLLDVWEVSTLGARADQLEKMLQEMKGNHG